MAIQIRKATEKDIPELLEIVNHFILTSTAIYDYEPKTLQQQKEWFWDKTHLGFPVIVAEVDDEIVGFGTYGTFRVRFGYRFTVEHSVYVSEKAKGRGIGKLLLSELIELAKLDGYHTMIGCIDGENLSSIGFHEKFGFEIAGTLKQAAYKFDRWLDLILMQLILK